MYRSVFVGIFGDNFMIIIWIDEDGEDGEDDKDEDCNDEDANLTELLVRSRVVMLIMIMIWIDDHDENESYGVVGEVEGGRVQVGWRRWKSSVGSTLDDHYYDCDDDGGGGGGGGGDVIGV